MFIEVTALNGEKIIINTDSIETIYKSTDGKLQLNYASGGYNIIQEEIKEIRKLLLLREVNEKTQKVEM